MKNKIMLLAMATTFIAFACDKQENQMTREDENQVTEEQPTQMEEKVEEVFKMTPEEFAKKAYEENMKEVQMAELAAKKSTDSEVKSFAQDAMKEHKKANNMLKPIAQTKNVNVPDVLPEDQMKEINKLREKSGKDFSKEYMEKVVDMHQKSVDMYQKASENLKDPALSSYASSMLPKLQHHLDEAKNIQKKLDQKPASVK